MNRHSFRTFNKRGIFFLWRSFRRFYVAADIEPALGRIVLWILRIIIRLSVRLNDGDPSGITSSRSTNYLKRGCLSYEVFEKAQKDGEWMEIEKFENKNHFKRVVARVDKDSKIPELFQRFCSIVNIKKNPVVTKEFVKRI